MSKFVIEGQKNLRGEIVVRGSKNAATPILAAAMLTKKTCVVRNLPRIADVMNMMEIMKSIGVDIKWTGDHEVTIDARDIAPEKVREDLVGTLRSSVLFFGALSGRGMRFTFPDPGGCQIGARPIDTHLRVLQEFGIIVGQSSNGYTVDATKKKAAAFFLPEMSVTATENAIIIASTIPRKTVLRGAAADPSVQDLCWFLQSVGVTIDGIGTYELHIQGQSELTGTDGYNIMPDPIETGTFLALAGASRSKLQLKNTAPEFLELPLLKFQEAGLRFTIEQENTLHRRYQQATINVQPSLKLHAIKKVHSMMYPGFATDLIPPFSVFMTQADGTTLIHDWMYEGRLKYIDELIKMGVNATICDPHRALIVGPTPLTATDITSFDLRAGATLIIAALIARGKSTISNAEQADRGYEALDVRLKAIGASIERIP